MRSDHGWGVTIGLCFLQTAIVAVFTCCGDPTDQGSAYKVHKRVCADGWRSVDTRSQGSLREGSSFIAHWGQQTLCLKVHHAPATWRNARDSCRRQHGILINLDSPGFVAPNMVDIIHNLAKELWGEGLRRLWTGMFVERDRLWWEGEVPARVYGKETDNWWEWLEGQPGQRMGDFGRLDLKNGTNNMSPHSNSWSPTLDTDNPFLFRHPSSVFRLGLTLVDGSNLLPYACINNGFELPPTQASKCPAGWYGSPYLDKCLWFSHHEARSYSAAEKVCSDKGGQLAMPQDSFYNAYVTKVILNAELGVLQADDPEIEESSQGHPEVGGASRFRCVFCTNAHTIEKCQPAADLLNGSCSPDKVCGLKVMKRSNGSLAYTAGCFVPSQCEVFGELALKHLCGTDEASYTVCCPTPECLHNVLSAVAEFTCEPKSAAALDRPSGASPTDLPEVECFTCDGVSSDEECIARGTVVRCSREFPSMKSPVCQTRVSQESRQGRVKITKGCASSTQCQSVQQQDCTAFSVAKKCNYCCEGHRCNQWLPDNPVLRSPLARRTWIGFQKEEANLIWVDGRVSSVAHWNSTFGSVYRYLPSTGCGQLWADRPWGSEWLVGKCTTSLPFVCEISAQNIDEDVQITRAPKDIFVSLQKLQADGFFSEFSIPRYDLTLTCSAANYHPTLSIVWVKDGLYFDNKAPPAGFSLDIMSEKLVSVGDSIYNLQGEYSCEVWDDTGRRRVRSQPATVRFKDVMTYQVSLRVPNHVYNDSIHSQATLLFNPSFKTGLDQYRRMALALTSLNVSGEYIQHHVSVNNYRSGSLVVDFTLFYELPTDDPSKLIHITGSSTTTSGGMRERFDGDFMKLVVERMQTKLNDRSSAWFAEYGSWGISPEDVTVLDTAACPSTVTQWRGRKLRWRRTPIGEASNSDQICIHTNDGLPIGTRRCGGSFHTGARWEEPLYRTSCVEEESAITPQLRSLAEEDISKANAEDILRKASSLIQGVSNHAMADIVYTTSILDDVVDLPEINVQSGHNAVTTASVLMKMNKTLLEDAQKVANSCNRLTQAIKEIGRRVNLRNKLNATFAEGNIIVSMFDILNETSVIQGVAYHGSLANFSAKHFTSFAVNQRPQKHPTIGVTLPNQLLSITHDSKESNESQLVVADKARVTFTLFQDTDLFILPKPNMTNTNGSKISNAKPINRPAVSVDIRGMKTSHLLHPVLTTFTFSENIRKEDIRCVFWDYEASNGSGSWSTTGCSINSSSHGRITCACNHLTTFSVQIMSSDGNAASQSVPKMAMTITLLIGLSVSIAGLGLAVLSFVALRSFRKTPSQQILFNLAVAVLLCNILFWLSLDRVVSDEYCVVMAALMHYFLLAAFTWILVEAILQFLKVVRMPDLPARYFTLKAAIAAWGFPLIVVGVVCAVDYLLYTSDKNLCWLKGLPLYFGFFLPVGVIFVVTLGVSCVVACRLIAKKTSMTKCTEVSSNISIVHVISNLLCFIILVATWVLAFFTLDSTGLVFQILFSSLDGFFGIYILLLLYFREPRSRKIWLNLFCCSHLATKKDSDSSTTSSVGTITSKIVPTLQKSTIHVEKNIYVSCPSEKHEVVKV